MASEVVSSDTLHPVPDAAWWEVQTRPTAQPSASMARFNRPLARACLVRNSPPTGAEWASTVKRCQRLASGFAGWQQRPVARPSVSTATQIRPDGIGVYGKHDPGTGTAAGVEGETDSHYRLRRGRAWPRDEHWPGRKLGGRPRHQQWHRWRWNRGLGVRSGWRVGRLRAPPDSGIGVPWLVHVRPRGCCNHWHRKSIEAYSSSGGDREFLTFPAPAASSPMALIPARRRFSRNCRLRKRGWNPAMCSWSMTTGK